MAANTREHTTAILSQKSRNVANWLTDLSKINNELVDTFAFSVINKWVTTKQTIEKVAATIEWWLSTRVYCDKEVYKGMYQKVLEQWTVLKHKIEHLKDISHSLDKKPTDLQKITANYYAWLCNLVTLWERKVNEVNVYPEKKVGFDTQDWSDEVDALQAKVGVMSSMNRKIEDILYMNHLIEA